MTDECNYVVPRGTRMRPEREVYHRLQHDSTYDLTAVSIVFEDRFAGLMEVPFDTFDLCEVPFHRIRQFKQDDRVLWHREARVDNIFNYNSGKWRKLGIL